MMVAATVGARLSRDPGFPRDVRSRCDARYTKIRRYPRKASGGYFANAASCEQAMGYFKARYIEPSN